MRERLRDERRKLREGRSVAFAIADPEADEFRGEVLLHTFEWQHARAAVGHLGAARGARAAASARARCGRSAPTASTSWGWRASR